jgi:hypothetical protein
MSNTIVQPVPVPKKSTPWKVIVPVIILVLVCCLFLIIAGIIAYIGTQGQGPAKFLATDTPTRTPTRTFTPTPEFVSVAIYDSDDSSSVSYFTGGWGNDVDSWETILNLDTAYRFSVSPVTDLYASTLAGFSRLILPDNSIPDFYLADVEAWLRTPGHTIIAADSGITYISYSGLFWEDSEYTDGEDIYWDYDSLSDDFKMVYSEITADIFNSSVLSSQPGDAQMYSYMLPADAIILAESYTDPSMIYAACRNVPGGGAVFVLGPFDEPEDDVYSFIRSVVFASRCE